MQLVPHDRQSVEPGLPIRTCFQVHDFVYLSSVAESEQQAVQGYCTGLIPQSEILKTLSRQDSLIRFLSNSSTPSGSGFVQSWADISTARRFGLVTGGCPDAVNDILSLLFVATACPRTIVESMVDSTCVGLKSPQECSASTTASASCTVDGALRDFSSPVEDGFGS